MKTSAFLIAGLVFCSLINLHGADAWKEQPIARAFERSATTTMGEYELWAEEWKRGKRTLTSSDVSVNLMAETTFIAVQMALGAHPNPELLERCLTFLGTIVPPECDDLWRARILEMAYLDKAITQKVDEILKAKKLPTLNDRAMGRE